MNIFEREYECVSNDGKLTFLIDGKDGSEYKGRSFYKYYELDKFSVDAFTHLYVYATHPCQFNDPFDCSEGLITFDDMKSIRILWDYLFPKFAESCQYDEAIMKIYSNTAYRTFLYMKWGVLCLSPKYNDLSMWAAYGNHRGFCVEFDVCHFPFKMTGPFHVNYQENLRAHSIKNISVQLASIVQTNVKHKCWEHEDEWRLLLECPENCYLEPFGEMSTQLKQAIPDYLNRKLRYPLQCIKSVCLGIRFFNGIDSVITDYEKEYIAVEDDQNEVLSFLALSKIPTYILDNDEFRVVRRPIELVKTGRNTYRILFDNN